MQRYHAEHAQSGTYVRHHQLLDASGQPVLNLIAANAVANERGLPVLYCGPTGMLNSAVGAHEIAVFRAKRPGMTIRGTHVVVVARPNGSHPDILTLTAHEPAFAGARFARGVSAIDLAGYANGLSDPGAGVWDLVAGDGRLIARHWARVGRDFMLDASDFDVYDGAVPLPELVCVMLARFMVWCPTRSQTGAWTWN
jgi:hypothetical protein